MFSQDVEKQLITMAQKAEGETGVAQEAELEAIIASLPEKQVGEIKAEFDGLLATIEVDDDLFIYTKRADRTTQKDGLLIKFFRNGELDKHEVISWEGTTQPE